VNSQQIAIVAIVIVVVVVLALVLRRRRAGLQVHKLGDTDATRYRAEFTVIAAEAEARPQVAAGRARGTVEEVLRRMGFPDRVDSAQKARDVAGYDRHVAKLLSEADAALHGSADPKQMVRMVELYGQALERLLPVEESDRG
jgi:hypothetical protein